MISYNNFRAIADVLVIVAMICAVSFTLFLLLKPRSKLQYVPSALSIQPKKKAASKKKKKMKDQSQKISDKADIRDLERESSSDEDCQNIQATTVAHRKSIELELMPELLDEQTAEKHEPHLEYVPNKPILKNRNFIENVDLNSSGVHYEHKIQPKDEVEIFHRKKHSKELNYRTNPGYNDEIEDPWATAFNDQDSSDNIDYSLSSGQQKVSKKRRQKGAPDNMIVESNSVTKTETHSQTEPFEDQNKHTQAQVNDLHSKLNKLTKDLKFSTDELAAFRKKYSSLEKGHTELKNREEDVSRTCQALQQELNQLIPKIKNAEKERDTTLIRLNSRDSEFNSLYQENQKLRQSISQLNGKLGVINNISNDNITLKNRLEQTETELRNLQQSSMICKNNFSDKESKWIAELTESNLRVSNAETRLQHCIRELDLERRNAEDFAKDINQLSEERVTQARTIEGLKEQFNAMNQKQVLLDREKTESQQKYQSGMNEMRAQVTSLTKQLTEALTESEGLKIALDEAKSESEQMVMIKVEENTSAKNNDVVMVNGLSEEKIAGLEMEWEKKERIWTSNEIHLKEKLASAENNLYVIHEALTAKELILAKVLIEKRSYLSEIEKYKEALATTECALETLQSMAEQEEIRQKNKLIQCETECQRLQMLLSSSAETLKSQDQTQKIEQINKHIDLMPENGEPLGVSKKKKMKKKQKKQNGIITHNDTLEEGEIRD